MENVIYGKQWKTYENLEKHMKINERQQKLQETHIKCRSPPKEEILGTKAMQKSLLWYSGTKTMQKSLLRYSAIKTM